MEPMPHRTARQSGGLLSHLHFQYASGPEHLFDPETNTLRSPIWYATMCDAAGTLLEQCNIVRALHRLPLWAELPEKYKNAIRWENRIAFLYKLMVRELGKPLRPRKLGQLLTA